MKEMDQRMITPRVQLVKVYVECRVCSLSAFENNSDRSNRWRTGLEITVWRMIVGVQTNDI